MKVFTLTAVGLGCFIIAGCGTSRPQSDHHHLDKASQAVAQALAWVHKQPQLHVPLEAPRWLPRTTAALSDNVVANSAIQQYTVGIWQTEKSLGVNNPGLNRAPKTSWVGWMVERWPGATDIKGLEVLDGAVLPRGGHSPVLLGRITGQAYAGGLAGHDHYQIPLVTWTEHGWTWEVIAPSQAAAENEASQVDAKLHNTSLPASEGVGFVNLVHGHPTLSLLWVRTHVLVRLSGGASSTHNVADTIKMASSWEIKRKVVPWHHARALPELTTVLPASIGGLGCRCIR